MPKEKENFSTEEKLKKMIIPKEEEPYKIPNNWVWTRLEDIGYLQTGTTPSTSMPEYFGEDIPFITPADITDEKIIYKNRGLSILGKEKSRVAKKNSILQVCIGSIGKVFYTDRDVCFNQQINSITLYYSQYKFVYFLLKSDYFYQSLLNSKRGTVLPIINKNTWGKSIIPLPPLEEQKRIVEKLDFFFEKTQKIKKIIEEVKEKSISKKENILSKAFRGELTEKWRSENKTSSAEELLYKINEEKLKLWEEECKRAEKEGRKKPSKTQIKNISEMLANEDEIPYAIPNNWVWTRLENIFKVERGGSPRPIKDFLVNNVDGINWIKIGDTELGKKYINSTKEKIKKEGIKKSRYVKRGDLLLTNSMSFGRAYILNCDGCIHDGWLVLQPENDKINREYFYYLLNSRYMFLVFSELAKGSTVKNLNKDIVKEILISLPPLEEQKEIVRILDKFFEDEDKISKLISLENKIEILEKTILDKAFCGELGTGNVNDIPAVELLKNILETNK